VPHPQLYEWYSAPEIISFFGLENDMQRLCDNQWFIFSASAACLANIGEPKISYFERASTFCWVAQQFYHVNDGRFAPFLPIQAVGSSQENCTIHLFVRPAQAQKYLYAGQLQPCCRAEIPAQRSYGKAFFQLKPALPSAVWERLGGLRLGNLDFTAVDQALDRLRSPMTAEDRFGVLQQLVNYWHGPILPEDGMSDVEIGSSMPLPLPLRWWYRWAGKRTAVMSGQNIMRVPRDYEHRHRMLALEDGRLIFYVENQGVYQWSRLPHGDDPPVFGRWERKGRWAQEKITLSEHLILMCLFEAVSCHAKYGASITWLSEDRLDEIVKNIPPVAIRPWRWLGTRFFVGQGVFVLAAENRNPKEKYRAGEKKYYSVHVSAKTEHPLQFLKPFLDDKWEYVAI
jgi:hypothetical protein